MRCSTTNLKSKMHRDIGNVLNMESERDPDLYRTDKYIIKYTYGKTAFEENAVFLFRNIK